MRTNPAQSDPVHARRTVKTLTINGIHVSGRDDQTILEVARENGIHIPTLCALEGLSTVAACRVCLVEVAGRRGLVPSCSTLIEEGMVVTTDDERLTEYRRKIVELLFSERNHVCAVCVSNGDCELQSLAQELGINHVRYPYLYPAADVDATHREFGIDHNRCILCTRCVRVCDEIEGAHTWDLTGRGLGTRVITDLKQDWGNSRTCTNCGKCVVCCPTGALFHKGVGVGEQKKDTEFLPYLTSMREARE